MEIKLSGKILTVIVLVLATIVAILVLVLFNNKKQNDEIKSLKDKNIILHQEIDSVNYIKTENAIERQQLRDSLTIVKKYSLRFLDSINNEYKKLNTTKAKDKKISNDSAVLMLKYYYAQDSIHSIIH